MNSNMSGFQFHDDMHLSELLMSTIKKIQLVNPIVKNNEKSETSRLQGNEYFKNRNYKDALEKYTESLCYAEKDSLEISLAYANRSALLFHKRYYVECLQDIERALKSGYLEENKAKLIDRRQRATKLLSKQKPTIFHGEIPQLKNPNPVIPAMSASIKFSNNEKFGTYIEATRDIQLGEILVVEKPYVFCVQNDFVQKYCSECGELCFNMIPCDECLTLYCSENCKVKAFDLYHQYECVVDRYFTLNPETFVLPTDESIDINKYGRKLPLRLTLRALKDLTAETQEKDTEYHFDCYEEVKKLKTHKNDPRLQQYPSIVQRERLILAFHLLISHTDIQTKFNVGDTTLKSLLFYNVLIHTINSMEIVAFGDIASHYKESYGMGLFPIFSRFNHACCPNSTSMNYGNAIMVIASRKIKSGEQCFYNYVGNYLSQPRVFRQLKARLNYCFECDCKACEEDWPQQMNPGTWFFAVPHNPFNEMIYEQLRTIHAILRAGTMPLETLWELLVDIYEKFGPEPSYRYAVLDLILLFLPFSSNKYLEF